MTSTWVVTSGLTMAMGAAMLAPGAIAIGESSLTVVIEGVRSPNGQICLNLFSGHQGFPNDRAYAVQTQCLSITEAPITVTFDHLQAGSYAISAYHDANSDNTFNRNGFGMPTEGFGFSQNPVVRTSAPEFGEAMVVIAGPSTTVQIQLQYL